MGMYIRAVQRPLEGQVLIFQKGHMEKVSCRYNLKLQFAVEGLTGEVAAARGLYWSETLDIKRNRGEILAD